MNKRAICYFIGHILRLESIFMIPALLISLVNQEIASVHALLITVAALLICGHLLLFFKKGAEKGIHAREGFVTVALAWIVISFFGALPFWISGAIPNFIDAFFETVSGFTTTGSTILTDIERMPMGLLYWRSFTHWLGGMGILVFMLAVVPQSKGSGDSFHLLRAESPGPQVGKLVPTMRSSARILYGIYIGLTLLEIVLLLCGGMPLFDSIVNAFGTAGTGGFAIKNASIAAYNSYYLQGVIAVFMVLFGVNFSIYYLLLVKEFKQAWRNEELRAYLVIVLASTVVIALNILPQYSGIWQSLHHAFFQVSSIITTTGFATADFNQWPELSRTLLVVLMIVGACAGSTGGGMKVSRMLILWKSLKNEIQKLLHPRSIKVIRMDGKVVDASVTRGVNMFLVAYCLICIVSILLVSLDNFDFTSTVTAVLACINNVGPGLEMVGPVGNFSDFSWFSKLVLSGNMLIGRLEIFPMVLLFAPSVWKRG